MVSKGNTKEWSLPGVGTSRRLYAAASDPLQSFLSFECGVDCSVADRAGRIAMPEEASDSSAGDQPLEQVSASDLTARVPERVGLGVFATGVIVLHSSTEVTIDFVQAVANPRRLVARVVMPPVIALQFLEALEINLGRYLEAFGTEPRVPTPNGASALPERSSEARAPASGSSAAAPPIADAYDQIRVPDEVLGGSYANTVSIMHTGSEFTFDFIHRGFPRSVVTSRVCMAAPRAPELRDSLRRSLRIG